jgi:acetyl-CoA C-acetyltransferase
VTTRKGEHLIEQDETPFSIDLSKIASLKPAFGKDGTVTAASSSSISDGAAAVIVTTAAAARERGMTPLARIVAYGSHAQAPEWFTTAPVPSIRKVLDRAGWQPGAVDLYEINEAFACVAMVAIQELGLDHARVNVNGGACALGHPIGATGARLITTLIHALRHRGFKRGIASQCIGGGEAASIAIEIPG